MSRFLLGFALVSAALQTGWALFAEGQFVALPAAAMALLLGSRYLSAAAARLRSGPA